MAKSNLFSTAKKKTTTTKATSSHERLTPSKDVMEADELYDIVEEFEDVQTRGKKLKAREDMLKGQLREVGLDTYLEKYEEDKKNPGTVIIEARKEGDVAQYLFVPTDRYKMVRTEEEADVLDEKFGEGTVERETTFSFDPAMLEKYSDVISELIESSKEIKDTDKGKLFVATEKFKIKGGTIDTLDNFDGEVKDVFEELKPVVAIKNAQVING